MDKDDLKREYDELMMKLDLWEKEVTDPSDSNKVGIQRKREDVSSKWESIKDASGDAWEESKEGFKRSLDELKSAYNEVTS